MIKDNIAQSEAWEAYYRSAAGKRFPDENLLRLIRGGWVDVPKSGRVLDVGFGTGTELIMLAQAGYEAHGLEVAEASLDRARSASHALGVDLTLGLLDGPRLTYPADHFDIVISWNAVYYLGTGTLVQQALEDYHRVLKPGGTLLLSTIHPNSWMVKRFSDDLGDGSHRIDKASPSDDRVGMMLFYASTSSAWRKMLTPFREVEEGYVEVDLFRYREAWRIFAARK